VAHKNTGQGRQALPFLAIRQLYLDKTEMPPSWEVQEYNVAAEIAIF